MYADKKLVISQDQVDNFCSLVNDTNVIHRADYENPVVPGMLTTSLIFEKPGDHWRLAKMEIRYSDVVYVDKEVEYHYNLLSEKTKVKKYSVLVKQSDRICLEAEILLVRKI